MEDFSNEVRRFIEEDSTCCKTLPIRSDQFIFAELESDRLYRFYRAAVLQLVCFYRAGKCHVSDFFSSCCHQASAFFNLGDHTL